LHQCTPVPKALVGRNLASGFQPTPHGSRVDESVVETA
jgi:hypothetical protein